MSTVQTQSHAPGEWALPSYEQAGPSRSTFTAQRLFITDHITITKSTGCRNIAVSASELENVNAQTEDTRLYIPKYNSSSAFILSQPDHEGPIISYVRQNQSGVFEMAYPHAGPTTFALEKSTTSKSTLTHLRSMFKDMSPIPLRLRLGSSAAEGIKASDYSWRTTMRAGMSNGRKPKEQLVTDLVLLNDKFQECARFVNGFESTTTNPDKYTWGILEVKNDNGDTLLREQIVLSLLALIEVHLQMAGSSGKYGNIFTDMLTGSVPCVLM